MSARVKVCFSDSEPCDQEVVIFDNVLVSKRPCEYDATYLKPSKCVTINFYNEENGQPLEDRNSRKQNLLLQNFQNKKICTVQALSY